MEFQQRFRWLRRSDLVWGLNYRGTYNRTVSTRLRFIPDADSNHLRTAFVQNEIAVWRDKLVLTLGSKFLSDSHSGFHMQPGAWLMWTPAKNWSAWASVSRAVRLPSRYERSVQVEFGEPGSFARGVLAGNPQLDAELARSHEAGFRRQWSKRVSTDLAVFRTHYAGLIDLPIGQPVLVGGVVFVPASFANQQTGRSWGTELVVNWEAHSKLRLSASHSTVDIATKTTAQRIGTIFLNSGQSSPSHLMNVRASGDLSTRMRWDVWMYHTGAVTQESIPAFTRLDGRWAWRPRSEWELSVGVRNAISARQFEYPSEDLVRSTARRDGLCAS